MAICTASEVVNYTDIDATVSEITASGLIPIVQERVVDICFDTFTDIDISWQSKMTFNATARTIISQTASTAWLTLGFANGDKVYVYGSHRNDGYYDVLSVSSTTMTLAVGESVVSELSGASIMVSLVKWPKALKYIAAQMVKFDHDDRPTRAAGLTSQSLGPRSESYAATDTGAYGYPADLTDALPRRVRLM